LVRHLLAQSLALVRVVEKLSLGRTIFLGTSGMYMKWRNGAVRFRVADIRVQIGGIKL
jgi:hypothetical protein